MIMNDKKTEFGWNWFHLTHTSLCCVRSLWPLTSNMSLILPYICLLLLAAAAQDCKTPGEQCEDDADCCGGCCKGSICIDSYGQCALVEDPCLSHECPPGFECYMYRSSDCPGCGKVPDCRENNDS
ncbi:uncharacterized protein LOC110836417 [Zootermopsis nevadensis]|uniref:uncharacterized protein LOC110836417 n=1 Tax=Zootermopsis nevadensis TaxID=136037 RepID=UPI000B8EA9DB|nr:uncharacterized protein LOC110836417 [Zootermopsis nevadensis]